MLNSILQITAPRHGKTVRATSSRRTQATQSAQLIHATKSLSAPPSHSTRLADEVRRRTNFNPALPPSLRTANKSHMKPFFISLLSDATLFPFFIFATISLAHATTQPTSEPLIQPSNLVYTGAFRLPEGPTNQTTFEYSGDGLAYNPANNSLFITGHTWYQETAEISIPKFIDSTDINSLTTATILQPLTDALEGRRTSVNPTDPNGQNIGGYLVYNGKLIISVYSYYDGSGTQSASHFVRPLSLSTTGQVTGPFRVGTQYPGFVSGYMSQIPADWQPLLGGPALTGNCCLNIISEQSSGPSVSVFDPSQLTNGTTVTATPLVGYPFSNPLSAWGTQNDLFNGSTQITGVVFPAGTRSVLFFGRQGTGPFCYGIGAPTSPPPSGECYDPANSSKGDHAYPYVYQVWAYDADDLLKVKQGIEPEYDVKPYAVWTLNLPFSNNTGQQLLSGAAYDPSTNQIFITQDCVDTSCGPVIDVLQITGLSANSSTPSAPSNVQVQ